MQTVKRRHHFPNSKRYDSLLTDTQLFQMARRDYPHRGRHREVSACCKAYQRLNFDQQLHCAPQRGGKVAIQKMLRHPHVRTQLTRSGLHLQMHKPTSLQENYNLVLSKTSLPTDPQTMRCSNESKESELDCNLLKKLQLHADNLLSVLPSSKQS